MSLPLKLPSARQPVTLADPNGNETFTRPWFLFFQAVWERLGNGGAIINEEALALAPASITPTDVDSLESMAPVRSDQVAIMESLTPVWYPDQLVVIEQLQTELSSQRDQIAELLKEIQALKQGYQL